MKYEDYLVVNIKIQELLRLQFPVFEISEKSRMQARIHPNNFFKILFLTDEVAKKIKVISRYKFETEDEEKLSGFMHGCISAYLEKILQYSIIIDEINVFSHIYISFSRGFANDNSAEGLAVSNSTDIRVENKINERGFIVIKNYVNQLFYAMVNYVSNLLSRLNNRESWTLADYQYRGIHEGVHLIKRCLLEDVLCRNIEWLKHCTRIGIVNCNDRFLLHSSTSKNLILNFLIYDIPLRLDYYQEIISKKIHPDEAALLDFIVQTKPRDGFCHSGIKLLEYLGDKYIHSSFDQYLSEKNLIGSQSPDSLIKEILLKYYIEYLLEKGFSPFDVNVAGVLAQKHSQLDCYKSLIASGFDIFDPNYFGFNLISLFLRYHGNSATLTIVNLLIYCASSPEVLARIFQQCITIFPMNYWEEYECYISTRSYPKAMLNSDEPFINGVPYSTLLDIALMHCDTDMIRFLIMLGLKLGNTTRQELHDEMGFLEDIAFGDEKKNGDFQNLRKQESLLIKSKISDKQILNLHFMYNHLTSEGIFQICEFKTLCAFIFLTKLPILDDWIKVNLADKLSTFDADGAFDIFSRFLIARNKQISIKTGREVFEDISCQLPIEIIDIIVNQMLSDNYWYLPFVIVKIANKFLFTEQQSLDLLKDQQLTIPSLTV